jgi:N-hydroxyarylamine O-acetyltransferase
VFDLEAYLARIGYTGDRTPNAATLEALHRAHFFTVPFENLDVLLMQPIMLDPVSLQAKLVTQGRGGYCFESNALFFYALQALGFTVAPLAARVLWERDDPAIPPRTHMLLMVDLDEGIYLADVAFGGQTPPRPLKMVAGLEQQTSHEPYRLRRTPEGELDLEARLGAEWKTLYRFTLHPQLPVDFEPANWYVSTHPDSFFTYSLVVARPAADCRYTLFNRESRTRWPDGRVETEVLADAAALQKVLAERFGLDVPDEAAAALLR